MRRGLLRAGSLVLGAAVFAGCASLPTPRAGGAPPPRPAPAVAPDWLGGQPLNEGDVFIVRTSSFLGTLSARHVAEGGFEHSMIFARNARGDPVLLHALRRGVEISRYPDFLEGYAHAVILRPRTSNEAELAGRLGDAARS